MATNSIEHKQVFKKIAAIFLGRCGLTKEQANEEIEMMLDRVGFAKLIDAVGKGKHENAAYVRMSRIGANFTLNRQKRVSMAMSINKAIEHSDYATGGDSFI